MLLYNSVAAGLMIALAGIAFLMIQGIVGAVAFSMGLIIICSMKFFLFTGKAGLIVTKEVKWKELIVGTIINIISAYCIGELLSLINFSPILQENANSIIAARMSMSYFKLFIASFFCGLLIYVAVTAYKATDNFLTLIFPVTLFIMCKFTHSIADAFYYGFADNLKWVPRELITVFGNFIGCVFLPFLKICAKGTN